jgi:ABC-2 type transport system ATP-binding protein
MNSIYKPHLAEVKAYFYNGDTHLGYRRLLDAAIETQSPDIYAATLSFCDWYDAWSNTKPADNSDLNVNVNELLGKIDQVPQPVTAGGIKLQAAGISKKYSSGAFSLARLDVALHAGKITGLVGENGNGKTTLLRLLYGELKPDTGTINYHINNIPVQHSFYDVKTRLAFIPQRPNAWYGSLMDNLQFTATHFGQTGKENYLWTEMIVARMGLRPFRTYNWSRISSGYKMRFELARTLVKKPELLLLDEPLANLDVLAQQVILEDLKYLARSQSMPMGIILSSQQLYEVEKVSEEVIFLQRGVARLQQTTQQESAGQTGLVLELETSASREKIQEIFEGYGMQKISFNGGVYILYFDGAASVSQLMKRIGEAELPVKYLRDISVSSRRFFGA